MMFIYGRNHYNSKSKARCRPAEHFMILQIKTIFVGKKLAFLYLALENIIPTILLQRPVYCFWRADFHGQGATLVTPDNLMYSLPKVT
jgi:hypothetical protein